MWHWTTRTGQYPEAVAFTRQTTEREPTVTDPDPFTDTEETDETEADRVRLRSIHTSFDLVG